MAWDYFKQDYTLTIQTHTPARTFCDDKDMGVYDLCSFTLCGESGD